MWKRNEVCADHNKGSSKGKNDNDKYITYFLKTFLSTALYEIKILIISQASDPESV